MPEPRGGDVDDAELERMRNYARAAREHPTWSVAYAQDVPKLLAEVAILKFVRDEHSHRLRFCEMVLDRNAVMFDGLPWREAARLREAADGIDEPETAPAAVLVEDDEIRQPLEVLRETLTHIALEADVDADELRRWALATLVELWPDDFMARSYEATSSTGRFLLEPRDRSAADLLAEVAVSGVEHDDERMDYVTVQIDRGLWDLVRMQRTDNA